MSSIMRWKISGAQFTPNKPLKSEHSVRRHEGCQLTRFLRDFDMVERAMQIQFREISRSIQFCSQFIYFWHLMKLSLDRLVGSPHVDN